jgi:hypothetical protein
MDFDENLEKMILGQSLDGELGQIPEFDSTVHKYVQSLISEHDLRVIGTSAEGEVFISEEDRESHIHILGAPGEGKSKFLEMMVSMDIDALLSGKSKSGACFIDSSDNGNTMKKVLKYCAHRGFEKVLLIDPHNIQDFGYVVPINPLNYKAPSEAMQGHITDSIRVLWDTKFSEEAIITTYLPHVIDALHTSKMTLPDSECLTIRELAGQRAKLLSGALSFTSKLFFQRVFTKERDWQEFQSTCRRLNPFFHSVMKATLGSVVGVDFRKLITDGWIILVNLYKEGVFEERHQRLLGTLILNEIIQAMSRIRHHSPDYRIPYYVYVDEFGKYATKKIADMLYYSRQSGLRMNLAHQEFEQIDKSVMSAVRSAAKSKVLFYVTNPDDRHQMVRMMYGGDLSDRTVEFTLSQTKKQNAVIKINKGSPVLARIRDWPDAPVTSQQLKDFITKLYTSNPQLYRPKDEVWGEIKNRFAYAKEAPQLVRRTNLAPKKGSDIEVSQRGTGNVRPTVGKGNSVQPGRAEGNPDIYNAEADGRQDEDIPVSWDIPVDDSDVKSPQERGDSKTDKRGIGKRGKG